MKPLLLSALLVLTASRAYAQTKLTFDTPETSGISMFRGYWDTPIPLAADGATSFWDGVPKENRDRGAYAVWSKDKRAGKPGALAFDALNRSLLVRFPGAAEKIAAALRGGQKIAKVELVLPFKDEELFPPGAPDWPGPDAYNMRTNWGIDALYKSNRPTWHAVAWALRRPWSTDETTGPTFNAAINGAVYWSKYGAADEKTDRFPTRFGPAEVSYQKSEAVEVTSVLSDAAFGKTAAERLRVLSDNGLLVRKWETYDHRYFRGVYEFATATGGRAVLINTPKLEVTLAPGTTDIGTLPPAADVKALAARYIAAPQGKPTAVIPPAAQIEKWATQSITRPAWMSATQWQRVQELMKLGGQTDEREPLWTMFVPGHIVSKIRDTNKRAGGEAYARPEDIYAAWVDQLISRQTRGWSGFETANEFTEWQLAKDILPGPAKDAIFRYWTDWLMPGRPTAPESQMLNLDWLDGSLVHPMVDQLKRGSNTSAAIEGDTYWLKTGDWRGNKSFFRSGFDYMQSTQNFNTTASTGAYIFGNLIGAPEAVADGKVGVDRWLLKGWIWGDGTGQEHYDHYYYTVTLKGLKALQNSAQDDATRLIGDSLVSKGVEEALLAWHPNLKRFIAPSSRTSLNYLLGTQEGGTYLMHALSHKGVLTDEDAKELPGGYAVHGHETPPALVALMTLQKPWVSQDMASLVDAKPIPWEATHSNAGQWRRTYLGKNYGLASSSTQGGRIQAMAQWRRADEEVTSARDLGTLDVRMGINETRWANDAAGWIWQPGKQIVAQSKNAWLALASPNNWNGGFSDGKTPVSSVQSSLGFFDLSVFQPGGKLPWDIYIDGKKVDALPATARQGQKIVIRDGVTYIGVIPLPSPNLGRDAEVVLEPGKDQQFSANGHSDTFRAGLVINSYIVKKDAPLTKETFDWYALDNAYAGFAVQFGDAAEGSFEAFQKKIAEASVSATFDTAKREVTAEYTTGGVPLQVKALTAAEKKPNGSWQPDFGPQLQAATIGGKPLYPAGSLLLDTNLDIAGWNNVEKNGAVLKTSTATGNGARLFLQTTTDKKRFVAWNPQGVPADLQLMLPGGLKIRSDGMLGLARIAYDTDAKTLTVDHAFTDGRTYGGDGKDTTDASALLLSGAPADLKVVVNGKTYAAHLALATIGTTPWRVLPLTENPRTKEQMASILSVLDKAPDVLAAASPNQPFLHIDYAGPFPRAAGTYGPEREAGKFDFKAVYASEGETGQDIAWRNWGTSAKSLVYGNPWPSGSQNDSVFMFRHNLSQSKGPCTYYMHAAVRSATAQDARLQLAIGNAPEELKFWLNGSPIAFPAKGGAARISLKSGVNHLLFKVRQDAGMPVNAADTIILKLGDPMFGLPNLQGVEWQAADGSWVTVDPKKAL